MSAVEYLPPLVTELKANISDLKKGFAEATALQKKYKENVEDLNTSFRKTKTDSDAAGKGVSDFERLVGSKMRTAKNSVAALREEYDKLHRRVKDLRTSVARGDGGGEKFDELKNAMGDLAKLGAIGADIGIKLGDGVGKGFGNAMAGLGPIVQTGLVVALIEAAIIASPIVGSTIAAALTVGLGAGVIGLGAYILKDDKQIKKAWEKLTDTTSGVFERAAQPMKKPFVTALKEFEKGFKKLEPEFKKLFTAAAPLVAPLGEGLLGMIKNMLPGMTEALVNAKPAFDALGKTMPLIGSAIGEFFKAISADGPGLALVLGDIMKATAGTIVLLGKLIGWFVSVYTWGRSIFTGIWDFLSGTWKKLTDWGNGIKKWLSGLFSSTGKAVMDGFINGVKSKLEKAKNAVKDVLGDAWNGAKKFLGIASPSRLYAEMGAYTVAGYVQGIDRNSNKAAAALTRMVRAGAGALGTPTLSAVGAMGGGGSRLSIGAAPVILQLDGRTLYRGLIPYAQQGKNRNASTGLS